MWGGEASREPKGFLVFKIPDGFRWRYSKIFFFWKIILQNFARASATGNFLKSKNFSSQLKGGGVKKGVAGLSLLL